MTTPLYINILLTLFSDKLQRELWHAVKKGTIDMVVSDHSPCTADLKILDKGDFMQAWGGISSLQFGEFIFLCASMLNVCLFISIWYILLQYVYRAISVYVIM